MVCQGALRMEKHGAPGGPRGGVEAGAGAELRSWTSMCATAMAQKRWYGTCLARTTLKGSGVACSETSPRDEDSSIARYAVRGGSMLFARLTSARRTLQLGQ